jgi:hypothetical protein
MKFHPFKNFTPHMKSLRKMLAGGNGHKMPKDFTMGEKTVEIPTGINSVYYARTRVLPSCPFPRSSCVHYLHRIEVKCQTCSRWLDAGHAKQHVCDTEKGKQTKF